MASGAAGDRQRRADGGAGSSTGRVVDRAFWNGRHVALTGGTGGIGLAATELLVRAGAHVTVIASDGAKAEALRDRMLPNVVVAPADVADAGAVAAALDRGRAEHGAIRSVITCAGITRPAYFQDLTDTDLRRQMEVNYFGTLYPVRLALPDLMSGRGGSITCVSSAAGLLGVFGYGAYCPGKFAVRGLCEVLRQEYRPHGITVTGVYPPDVDTPMLTAEQPLKPPETLALSSGEKPLTALAVARAMLKGTESGRASVVPGASTKVLKWVAGAAPGLLFRYIDATIARARKGDVGRDAATRAS
ncbi:SDR family NAD(P)-dependent oxidoreductase [Streptomyces sp. NPDC020298]|uniref:SDR family NAD(P)-dependent oxidoreductase n=1 Tax=unclassified Streptomyces TaxID=2593676 RepID=UPI0033F47C58